MLVEDPSSHPDRFPTEADQEVERQRLFRLIEELVPWEATSDPKVLEAAHEEIPGIVSQPEGSGSRTRWGNCWVVVVLVLELECLGGRAIGLPVLFRLFRAKDEAHPDRPSQPEPGRLLVDIVIDR